MLVFLACAVKWMNVRGRVDCSGRRGWARHEEQAMTTRQWGRRVGTLACLVASSAAAVGVVGTPAGAATAKACKVLKKVEIQAAFGGTVSTARKGLGTSSSNQCQYEVSASGDRPQGTIVVHVMTTGAKAAFGGLEKRTSAYVPIDGVPNSLYAEKTHVVNILQGKVLLGVQGNFVVTDPLPVHFYDVESQLTGLAQIGAGRISRVASRPSALPRSA
jgi:hypothetical protein